MNSITITRSYLVIYKRFKWKTIDKKEIFVDQLTTKHLRNIYGLLCDRKRCFPKKYLGIDREKWRMIILKEIHRRVNGNRYF